MADGRVIIGWGTTSLEPQALLLFIRSSLSTILISRSNVTEENSERAVNYAFRFFFSYIAAIDRYGEEEGCG